MPDTSPPEPSISPEARAHYDEGNESGRLNAGQGRLELVRTRELLERFLPAAPAEILDVGGAAGVHAIWLASRGYTVDLIDPVPLHVDQARAASDAQPDHPLRNVDQGDARALAHGDGTFDAVLLLGPLYHLTERDERVTALREAARVVRSGGVVLSATISQFASAFDGLLTGELDDPVFAKIVEQDLVDGQHRNPTSDPAYFTTAYFHHPDEIPSEIADAGLKFERLLGIEGPGWLLQNLSEHWDDDDRRERLLGIIRAVESEPSLAGISAHALALSRRPDADE